MKNKTKLIVALDKPTFKEAEDLVRVLSPKVKIFKIGSQLFTACGPEIVKMVREHKGEVFLDLKFHDIPNTVAKAAISALRLGVFMFNVHAMGGRVMLLEVMRAVNEEIKKTTGRKPIVLGVTVLTSMDRAQLNSIGILRSVKNEVIHLAQLSAKCGLDGVVCSGKEIKLLKRVMGKDFILVVPGVRPNDTKIHDQKRIITPGDAARHQADYIVVGRPIIENTDPLKAAEKILNEIK